MSKIKIADKTFNVSLFVISELLEERGDVTEDENWSANTERYEWGSKTCEDGATPEQIRGWAMTLGDEDAVKFLKLFTDRIKTLGETWAVSTNEPQKQD